MRAIVDIVEIEKALIHSIERVELALRSLRFLFDENLLAKDERELCLEMWMILRELFQGELNQLEHPVIEAARINNGPTEEWLILLKNERSIKDVASGKFADVLGNKWGIERLNFESNLLCSVIPKPFLERIGYHHNQHSDAENPISRVLAIHFQGRGALTEFEREEIEQKNTYRVTSWETLQRALARPALHPLWDSLDSAKTHVKRVCKKFREEGLTDFTPSDRQIEQSAISIIEMCQPTGPLDQDDQIVERRLAAGDLNLDDAMTFSGLFDKLRALYRPIQLTEEQLRRVLIPPVEDRRIIRRVLKQGVYYFTTDGRVWNKPKPAWKERKLWYGSLLVKEYMRHPAQNQTLILDVFEENSWVNSIDDPLPPFREKNGVREKLSHVESKARLTRTVGDLKKSLGKNSPIQFSCNGKGTGINWQHAAGRT